MSTLRFSLIKCFVKREKDAGWWKFLSSNSLKKRSTRDWHARRQVGRTWSERRSQRQSLSCDMPVLIKKSLSLRQRFVFVTGHTNFKWSEFVRQVAATKWHKLALSPHVHCPSDLSMRQRKNQPVGKRYLLSLVTKIRCLKSLLVH